MAELAKKAQVNYIELCRAQIFCFVVFSCLFFRDMYVFFVMYFLRYFIFHSKLFEYIQVAEFNAFYVDAHKKFMASDG